MTTTPVVLLTLLAMIAFAGNSLLCRLALKDTHIDAATFTTIRLISGALVLWLIVLVRRNSKSGSRSWLSALALFTYASCFSFAYLSLPAGTGALLLFGAVQATMIGYGLWVGERLRMRQTAGFIVALGGLVLLVLPGLSAPPLFGSGLMLIAGVAWGTYSLRGRYAGEPIRTTAENFLRAVPLALVLSVIMSPRFSFDRVGFLYAIASGALASGVGYAIWYTAVRGLRATQAATVQLSVPVIATGGGIAFLGEQPGLRLVIASGAILGGIALVVLGRRASNDI